MTSPSSIAKIYPDMEKEDTTEDDPSKSTASEDREKELQSLSPVSTTQSDEEDNEPQPQLHYRRTFRHMVSRDDSEKETFKSCGSNFDENEEEGRAASKEKKASIVDASGYINIIDEPADDSSKPT